MVESMGTDRPWPHGALNEKEVSQFFWPCFLAIGNGIVISSISIKINQTSILSELYFYKKKSRQIHMREGIYKE